MNKSAVQTAKPLYDLLTLQISLVPWDYLLVIIEESLGYRKRASSPAAAKLNNMLSRIQFAGFRNASKAPGHLLADNVALWCAKDQSGWWLRQILSLWRDSRASLRDSTRELMKRLGSPITFDVSTAKGFEDVWESAQLEDWTHQLEQLHPGVQKRDLQLMLSCVTGRVLIPPEHLKNMELEEDRMQSESPESIAPVLSPEVEDPKPPWSQCLEAAHMLAPDAPAWRELDAFINELRSVAASKARKSEEQQAQRQARQILTRSLEALQASCVSELEFFGFTDTQTWTADAFAPKDHPSAAQSLERLREVLLRNQELTQLPRAKNLEENRARQEQINKTQEEATTLHRELLALLSNPTKPPDGSGPSSSSHLATTPEILLRQKTEGLAQSPPAPASTEAFPQQDVPPQQSAPPSPIPQAPEPPLSKSEILHPPAPSPKQVPVKVQPFLAPAHPVDVSPAPKAVPHTVAPAVQAEDPLRILRSADIPPQATASVATQDAVVAPVEALALPPPSSSDANDASSQAAPEPQTTSSELLFSQVVPGRQVNVDYFNAGLERLAHLDTPGAFILMEASNHSSSLPWFVFLTEQAFAAVPPATERPSTPEIDTACNSVTEASSEWTELDKRLAGLVCTSLVVLDGLLSPPVHGLFQLVREKTPTPPSYLNPFFRFWDVSHKPVVALRKLLEDERSLNAQLATASEAVLEALKLCRHMQFNFSMGNRFIAKVFPPNGGPYSWIESAMRSPVLDVLDQYAEQLEDMKYLAPDEIIDDTCGTFIKSYKPNTTIDWSARIAIRQRMLDLRERIGEWESLVRALLEPRTRRDGTNFFREHLLELSRGCTNLRLPEPRSAQDRVLHILANRLLTRCHLLLGVH